MCQKLYAVLDTKDGYYYSFAHNDWFEDLLTEGCLTPSYTRAENIVMDQGRRKLITYELKQVG